MENQEKKRILSMYQCTGTFTLGNYLGALRNHIKLQEEGYDCAYALADLHALTVRQVPAELRKYTKEAYAWLLAMGIDLNKTVFFIQSQVPQHSQLAWLLNCYTQFGELSRMTQFKDKSAKHADNINAGLFTYPCLMAADILLYQTDVVPVGADQRQHLEIARDIAQRFNNVYTPTFKVPEGLFRKVGAKINDLQEPAKKMSKSAENPNGAVFLTDDRDTVIRKFKRAVTDSDAEIRYEPESKAGVSNLISIYSVFAEKSIEETEREFCGKGYGDFKLAVGELVADKLAPIQAERERLLKDKEYIESALKTGAERAAKIANRTLAKVYKKIGFYQL